MKKEFKKEITINLSEPIEYAPKGSGQMAKSQILIIFCPTQKELASVNVIDIAYSKYLSNAQKSFFKMFGLEKLSPFEMTKKVEEYQEASKVHSEKNKEKKENKFSLSEMKGHITGEELTNCYSALQNILCGSAKLDAETCINTISYSKLQIIDLENILTGFIENFIIRSHQSLEKQK